MARYVQAVSISFKMGFIETQISSGIAGILGKRRVEWDKDGDGGLPVLKVRCSAFLTKSLRERVKSEPGKSLADQEVERRQSIFFFSRFRRSKACLLKEKRSQSEPHYPFKRIGLTSA